MNVDFHVTRLRGISKLKNGFWPKQQTPKCTHDTQHWHSEVRRTIPGAELAQFPCHYGLQGATVAKVAVVLFNYYMTSELYALFNTTVAARSWPFLESFVIEHLASAMGIAGPMMIHVLTRSVLFQKRPYLPFLTRIKYNKPS